MARPKGSVSKKKNTEIDDVISSVDNVIDDLKNKINDQRKIKQIDENMLVPTGSTLLNLCLSGTPNGGYGLGKFANLIGDSAAGKSLLALTGLAECANLKRFDNYDLIYDDTEASLEFDLQYLFGEKAYKRIRTDLISEKFEDWQDNIERCIRSGKPFIYVLDSFDALTSTQEIEKGDDNFKAREKGNKEKGSYGDGKPLKASQFFRMKKGDIKNMNSFVLIISQTRDNIGFGAQFNPKVRSGGKALKFYSTHEIWLAMKGQLKEKAGSPYVIGNLVEAKTTKNKLTGKRRICDFQVFYDYGVDDLQSCIDYLVASGRWNVLTEKDKKENEELVVEGRGTKYFCHDFNYAGDIKNIIKRIEDNNLENDLISLVTEEWNKVEDSLKLDRKPRFK